MSRYSGLLSTGAAPNAKAQKPRVRREPSGQFKEAFSLIDQDNVDGDSAGGSARGVNFTMFLTMMGEHLFEFDAGQELIEAFECFDESDTGFVKVDGMRRWLSEVVDRMEPAEIDQLFKGPFTDRNDNFNCREWIKILRINADTEQDGEAS
ncbi:calcium-binding EF-hand domain-containing protein [Auriculariales sp. MPI-PUGE-AT-0066]|nr:calcium-binding EF-hand domain-containing protein [Auriculariales sp. MPI-PUGE-AT-0066]